MCGGFPKGASVDLSAVACGILNFHVIILLPGRGGDPSNPPPPPDSPLHLRDSAHSFILHISRVISMRSYVSDHNVTRHQAENIFK